MTFKEKRDLERRRVALATAAFDLLNRAFFNNQPTKEPANDDQP